MASAAGTSSRPEHTRKLNQSPHEPERRSPELLGKLLRSFEASQFDFDLSSIGFSFLGNRQIDCCFKLGPLL